MIGVIDTGVTAHPLFDGVVIESVGVPAALGTVDDYGHGTKVAGIAEFGDVRVRIESGMFAAPGRVISVRVTNANGCFDDNSTIAEQMCDAIRLLADRGCRVAPPTVTHRFCVQLVTIPARTFEWFPSNRFSDYAP